MAVRLTSNRGPQVVTVSIGLLVSACVNRAPEGLHGAAIAEVGVHDLLKVLSLSAHASYPALNMSSSHSLLILPLDTPGLPTMATLMMHMTSTSFIRYHRCTTCRPIKSFRQRCYSRLIVRNSQPYINQLSQAFD